MALNHFHSGTSGGHFPGVSTMKKIPRGRYYWPSLFHDSLAIIKHYEARKIFSCETEAPPYPLHLVIHTRPFTKWGVKFMEYHPPSINECHYIIMVMEYFKKWVKAMPMFCNVSYILASFLFCWVCVIFFAHREVSMGGGGGASPPFSRGHRGVDLPCLGGSGVALLKNYCLAFFAFVLRWFFGTWFSLMVFKFWLRN
jgi:hypothetical protein